MAEEGASPGTESPAPTEGGQVEGQGTGSVESSEGQGGAAPGTETGQGGKAPTGGETGGAGAKGGEETPAWDGDTLKWMESKGYEAAAYDPANESHTKLIKQVREQERSFTRQQQEDKAKESFQKAQKATGKQETGAEEDQGPIAVFEDSYKSEVTKAMRYNKCSSAEELLQKAPEIYAELERMYPIERQKAWEKEQEWKKTRDNEKSEQEKIQNQYREDFENAKRLSNETLTNLRKTYPNLDTNFSKYGVDKFLDTIADKYSVFREMLFLDENVAKFLAEASDAIAYRYAEPDRKKEWEQEYEKNKLELAKATGPRPSGISGLDTEKSTATGSGWEKNLNKHSRDLIKK